MLSILLRHHLEIRPRHASRSSQVVLCHRAHFAARTCSSLLQPFQQVATRHSGCFTEPESLAVRSYVFLFPTSRCHYLTELQVAINLLFNRETREDGGMPPFERSYLNDTFMHTGLGLGIIAIAARALHTSGWSVRLMTANPWLVFGGGLALSIGTMMGTFSTSPDKYVSTCSVWRAANFIIAMSKSMPSGLPSTWRKPDSSRLSCSCSRRC